MTEQTFEDECDDLRRIVLPKDNDNRVKRALNLVWAVVSDTLKQRNKGDLATLGQFRNNVKRKGEPQFFDLLRDIAGRDAWHELFENGNLPRCFRHGVF
jgi:hypothetical protein